MDSLTQFVLGAAVAESVMANKVGRKAAVWGGLLGTLPDLDVFIPLGDAVSDFTYHRSASHSLFILALASPAIVWLIKKIHPQFSELKKRWLLMVLLVFVTHVVLDSFTAYGTQIFWPVVTTPMSWSTIFIIDPLFTLPLIIGVLSMVALSNNHKVGPRINQAGLILSSLYLCWTLVAKQIIDNRIEETLQNRQLSQLAFFTTPTPFNSLLWRTVVKTELGYYEGYVSVFDPLKAVRLDFYPSEYNLLENLSSHWPVTRLQWFTGGFYSITTRHSDIVISDLRMGLEPDYVFQFKVAEKTAKGLATVMSTRVEAEQDLGRLKLIWQRIWDPSIII